MVGCSAPNCTTSSEKGIRQFGFPTDESRRQRWLINCRRDAWTPTCNSRLCEQHFEDSQFEKHRLDGRRKLKPNAVPTIFRVPNPPPQLASTRRVLKRHSDENDDAIAYKRRLCEFDHCYFKTQQKKAGTVLKSIL